MAADCVVVHSDLFPGLSGTDRADLKIAELALRKVWAGQKRQLVLKNLNLTSLPAMISTFTWLEMLYCSNNSLSELPHELFAKNACSELLILASDGNSWSPEWLEEITLPEDPVIAPTMDLSISTLRQWTKRLTARRVKSAKTSSC